jgi:hypothetical protein
MSPEDKPITIKERLVGLGIVTPIFFWSVYQLYEDDIYHLWLNSPGEFRNSSSPLIPAIFSLFAIIYLVKKVHISIKESKPNKKMKADEK